MPVLTSYCTSYGSVNGWNNPTNAIGAPDGNWADSNFGGDSQVGFALYCEDFAALPSNATINQVFIGARYRSQNTVNIQNLRSFNGDGTNKPLQATLVNTPEDFEFELNAAAFTPASIKTGNRLLISLSSKAGGGYDYIDAMWMRVVYNEVARAKRWTGSAWVDAAVKRWNGSAWVTVLPSSQKRWSGSAWV